MAEHDATLNDLLVAFGRLEAQLTAVNEKLDKLDNLTEKRLDEADLRIAELERQNGLLQTRVAVLEVEKPKRISGWTISSALVSIATIIILVLDRFYVNQ